MASSTAKIHVAAIKVVSPNPIGSDKNVIVHMVVMTNGSAFGLTSEHMSQSEADTLVATINSKLK